MAKSKIQTDYEYAENNMQEIVKYIPGGMHVCYLSDPIHLDYGSLGLCKMLGYTREEFEEKTQGIYINHMPEEDHQIFVDFVVDLSQHLGKKTVEYRMIKKDGSIIYVQDTMESMVCSDGIIRGYSSVTDITERKMLEKELDKERKQYKKLYKKILSSEERFKLITSFTGIMFYEWNLKKQSYTYFQNTEKVLKYKEHDLIKKLKKLQKKSGYTPLCGSLYFLVYEEDKEYAQKKINELMKIGETKLELRILSGDNQYHWYSIEAKVTDKDKDNILEMGCIQNIDDTKTKINTLIKEASMDKMTNLLNKITFMNKVTESLSKNHNGVNGFLFFDLDNFKKINDTLGHQAGDEVLCHAAYLLKDIFQDVGIVGRYGGDEFSVFIENIKDKDDVLVKSLSFNERARDFKLTKNNDLQLSASVGVSFSDENSTAKSLLLEADKYAYKAKQHGKKRVYYKKGHYEK